jgi:hypothetical protein
MISFHEITIIKAVAVTATTTKHTFERNMKKKLIKMNARERERAFNC